MSPSQDPQITLAESILHVTSQSEVPGVRTGYSAYYIIWLNFSFIIYSLYHLNFSIWWCWCCLEKIEWDIVHIWFYRLSCCISEKAVAPHSSTLAWRIPGMAEPGGLPSMGSHRIRHDWSDLPCMHALEKEMATLSSILAWRVPGMEEPGGLPSMGSHRVRHDWGYLAAAAAEISSRKLQIPREHFMQRWTQ